MNVPTKAQEAAELIDRLERLVRASEQAGDLNPAQWEVLRYLARANRFSRTPADRNCTHSRRAVTIKSGEMRATFCCW